MLTDIISEGTSGSGVTVDGMLIKDGMIPLSAIPTPMTGKDADTLDGYEAAVFCRRTIGEIITGAWIFNSEIKFVTQLKCPQIRSGGGAGVPVGFGVDGLKTYIIVEEEADVGVTIDGLLVKDGGLPSADDITGSAGKTLDFPNVDADQFKVAGVNGVDATANILDALGTAHTLVFAKGILTSYTTVP